MTKHKISRNSVLPGLAHSPLVVEAPSVVVAVVIHPANVF